MSVTIAVPGIPGTVVDSANPLTQDGGMISPRICVIRASVSIAVDTVATLDLDDYDMEAAWLWGWVVESQGSVTEDPSTLLVMKHHTLGYDANNNWVVLQYTDPATVQGQLWVMGPKKRPPQADPS